MQPDEPVFLLAHEPNPAHHVGLEAKRATVQVLELVRKGVGPIHAGVHLFMVRTFREEVEERR